MQGAGDGARVGRGVWTSSGSSPRRCVILSTIPGLLCRTRIQNDRACAGPSRYVIMVDTPAEVSCQGHDAVTDVPSSFFR
jgi:hypothetical protein